MNDYLIVVEQIWTRSWQPVADWKRTMSELGRKARRREEETSPQVLKVLVDQAHDLAEEAKTIALSAKKHVCLKENELSQLQTSMARMSETNMKVAEELGKWKWFRVLIWPIAALVIMSTAGAITSFNAVQIDVAKVKDKYFDVAKELKTVKTTQRALLDATRRSEEAEEQSEKNMKSIAEKLEEIAKNTKVKEPKRRRK